jgi:hypothetical protein
MSKSCDPRFLVGAIKSKIDATIAGNNPAQLPVQIGTAAANDQTFDVVLGVTWICRTGWERFPGSTNPPGSYRVNNGDDGNQLLLKRGKEQAENERYVDGLLAWIAGNPTAATALGNTLLAPVSGAAHFHEKCSDCHGSGQVPCGCANGRVICYSCKGSGKGICPKCKGTGMEYVYVQEQVGNDITTILRPRACWCVIPNCDTCRGNGALICPRCDGKAMLNCPACDATGWFTHLCSAKIYSSIERSLRFSNDAPATFAAYLEDHGMIWWRDNADYVLTQCVNDNGTGRVTIAGTAPYANVSFVVAGQGFTSEAFGTRADVKVFPPFLDPLLNETVEAIKRPRADVADWFGAVQESRLLKQLFDLISDGDKEAVPAALRLSHGAASRELLSSAEAGIKAGLRRVGRKAVTWTWLVGASVTVLAVPIVAAAGVWGHLAVSANLSMAQLLCAAALAPLVVFLPTWLAAYLLWRREAKRAFLGKAPAHGPRQRWRLVPLTILLAVWNVIAVGSLYARGWPTATSMGFDDRLVEMEHNTAAFISTANAGSLVKLWDDAFDAPIESQAQQPVAAAKPASPTAIKARKKVPVTHSISSGSTSALVPAPSVVTAGTIQPSLSTNSSPPLPENIEAQSQDADASVQSLRSVLLGTWRGTYICAQGESAAELVISDVTDQGVLHGTFHFFNLPNQHNVAPGEYTVSATYDASGNSLLFTPVKWVLAPPGYLMVGFNVSLESKNKLTGRFTSSGCKGISLQK